MDNQKRKTRRQILKAGLALTLMGLGARPALASLNPTGTGVRELAFFNLHTGESLKTAYWADGDYVPEALSEVNYIFRDFRTDQSSPIAPALLDLLHKLKSTLDTSNPFQIISGYRSPVTNAFLSSHTESVAKGSLHMEGKAADIHIEGLALNDLLRAAIAPRGGVGYYPNSDFVHIDIGRVRTW